MTTKPAPASSTPQSLTNPADLLALFGRFVSASLLMILTIMLLFRHYYMAALLPGIASVFLQLATTRLWRRLREERLAKKAALAAEEAA